MGLSVSLNLWWFWLFHMLWNNSIDQNWGRGSSISHWWLLEEQVWSEENGTHNTTHCTICISKLIWIWLFHMLWNNSIDQNWGKWSSISCWWLLEEQMWSEENGTQHIAKIVGSHLYISIFFFLLGQVKEEESNWNQK